MSVLHQFEPGEYQFLQGGFPYSQGVIAAPGMCLVRARFADPPGIDEGFLRIAAHLQALGRPLTSLCAAELRSPRPFSLQGFREFNSGYVRVLSEWGLVRNGLNPVARSNVCPVFDPPESPRFYAFCYSAAAAQPDADQNRDFVVAGSGEWPEGEPFPEAIVARGDISASGMAAKTRFVIDTMRNRCAGLAGQWSRLSAAQIYTAHDIHPLLGSHFAAAGLLNCGITWQVCRPPIEGLEFEMDVRSVSNELVL